MEPFTNDEAHSSLFPERIKESDKEYVCSFLGQTHGFPVLLIVPVCEYKKKNTMCHFIVSKNIDITWDTFQIHPFS